MQQGHLSRHNGEFGKQGGRRRVQMHPARRGPISRPFQSGVVTWMSGEKFVTWSFPKGPASALLAGQCGFRLAEELG